MIETRIQVMEEEICNLRNAVKYLTSVLEKITHEDMPEFEVEKEIYRLLNPIYPIWKK